MGEVGQYRHVDYLDGWRGGSIALLLIGHFNLMPLIAGRNFNPAGLAVECFFVLSGRLMADILFVRRTPLVKFYVHRISRIVPALWLFVFSMFIATQFAPRLNVEWSGVITALTFTRNYWGATDCLEHLWSLCVEEHAYVLLSLIAVAHRRSGFNVTKILLTISIAMALNGAIQFSLMHRVLAYWQSDVRISSILISAALYLHFRERNIHPIAPVAAILAGFAIYLIGSIPNFVRFTVATSLLSFGMATADSLPTLFRNLLSLKVARYLGFWSFTLYLWQQPFTHYDGYLLPVLLLLLSFVTLVTFYFFEQPSRGLINRSAGALLAERAKRFLMVASTS
jgi:peptidoglycan/LPS O-acetylase OafA/YrhL